jgi:hypothetical protein
VIILKSKHGDLNLVIGQKGIVRFCWDVSTQGRQQPEYEVEIDGRHWLVLEEEIKSSLV